jgi:hypothetical protein
MGDKHAGSASAHRQTERLAYALWDGRGRPFGSPEVDWFRAEDILRRRWAAGETSEPYRPALSKSGEMATWGTSWCRRPYRTAAQGD